MSEVIIEFESGSFVVVGEQRKTARVVHMADLKYRLLHAEQSLALLENETMVGEAEMMKIAYALLNAPEDQRPAIIEMIRTVARQESDPALVQERNRLEAEISTLQREIAMLEAS